MWTPKSLLATEKDLLFWHMFNIQCLTLNRSKRACRGACIYICKPIHDSFISLNTSDSTCSASSFPLKEVKNKNMDLAENKICSTKQLFRSPPKICSLGKAQSGYP